jgi:hypothetical protein
MGHSTKQAFGELLLWGHLAQGSLEARGIPERALMERLLLACPPEWTGAHELAKVTRRASEPGRRAKVSSCPWPVFLVAMDSLRRNRRRASPGTGYLWTEGGIG